MSFGSLDGNAASGVAALDSKPPHPSGWGGFRAWWGQRLSSQTIAAGLVDQASQAVESPVLAVAAVRLAEVVVADHATKAVL